MEPMNTTQVFLVRSAKGNDMLCVDNYLYHFEDCSATNYRWVCNRRKECRCNSRVTTTLVNGDISNHTIYKVTGEHTHGKASSDEILKVFERKRLSDLNGDPCTMMPKPKRKKNSTGDYEPPLKKRIKSEVKTESEEDSDSSAAMDCGNEPPNNEDEEESDVWPDSEDERKRQVKLRKTKSSISKDGKRILHFKENKVYVLKTQLGHSMVCVNGFLYRLEGRSPTKTSYRWECIKRHEVQCTARIITDIVGNGDSVHEEHALRTSSVPQHKHDPYTPSKLTKLLQKNNLILQNADADAERSHEKSKKSDPLANPKAFVDAEERMVGDYLIRFLPSNKGNQLLCINNFIYHSDSHCKKRRYWTCVMRRDKAHQCRVRATTESSRKGFSVVRISGLHNHPDGQDDIQRRLREKVNNQKVVSVTKNAKQEADEDFKPTVDKLKERRVLPLRHNIKHESVQIDGGNISDNSSNPFSGLDSDYDDDKRQLPTKLEDMRAKVEPKRETVLTPKQEINYAGNNMTEQIFLTEGKMSPIMNENDTYANDAFKLYTDDKEHQMDISKVSTLTSPKGGKILCVDGYGYYWKSSHKNRNYWTCRKRKDKVVNCPSRVTTVTSSDGAVKICSIFQRHTHTADDMEIKLLAQNGPSPKRVIKFR